MTKEIIKFDEMKMYPWSDWEEAVDDSSNWDNCIFTDEDDNHKYYSCWDDEVRTNGTKLMIRYRTKRRKICSECGQETELTKHEAQEDD